jgi:hypothetical protein
LHAISDKIKDVHDSAKQTLVSDRDVSNVVLKHELFQPPNILSYVTENHIVGHQMAYPQVL